MVEFNLGEEEEKEEDEEEEEEEEDGGGGLDNINIDVWQLIVLFVSVHCLFIPEDLDYILHVPFSLLCKVFVCHICPLSGYNVSFHSSVFVTGI